MIPYERKPKYLSPSSLASLESNPTRFYFERCGPKHLRPKKFQQTGPMAVGCGFDSMVKFKLGRMLGKPIEPDFLEQTVDAVYLSPESFVLWESVRAIRAYFDSPAARVALKDGLSDVETFVEPRVVYDHGRDVGVPIWGKPDASELAELAVVWDYKVTGSITGSGKVNPGYKRLWYHDGYSWRDEGPHIRCLEGMHTLNKSWATQLCMYGWLLGVPLGTRFMGAIEQIVMVEPPEVASGVRIAQIRAPITPDFQQEVFDRLLRGWSLIQNERLVPEMSMMDLEILAMTL